MHDMYTIEYNYLFHYKPLYFENNGKPMLSEPRPAIFITLWNKTNSLQIIALIDSGSTYSLFDYQLGVELGLDVRSGRMQWLSSLGGSVLGYAHQIELEIVGGWKFKTEVLFSDDAIPRNLLGHYGFLEHLAVGLQGKIGEIYLGVGT
jgi:hypothetical protein